MTWLLALLEFRNSYPCKGKAVWEGHYMVGKILLPPHASMSNMTAWNLKDASSDSTPANFQNPQEQVSEFKAHILCTKSITVSIRQNNWCCNCNCCCNLSNSLIFGCCNLVHSWMFAYLDICMFGYLDSPTLRFCVVQPCRFLPEKNRSLDVLELKTVILEVYLNSL